MAPSPSLVPPADATTSIVADPAVPAGHVSSAELEPVLVDEVSSREVLAGRAHRPDGAAPGTYVLAG